MYTPPQHLPDSQLSSRPISTCQLSNPDAEKSWHLLALLLSHGKPVDPSELASKCTLFRSNPDLINFLCSIPNSPIQLSHNNRVTVSETGLTAVARFFFNYDFKVTDSLQLSEGVRLSDNVGTYCRKRKRVGSEIEIFSDGKNMQCKRLLASNVGTSDLYAEVLGRYMSGRHEAWSNFSSLVKIDCRNLEKAIISPLMPTICTSQQQYHESPNIDDGYSRMEDSALMCHSCLTRFQPNSLSNDTFLYHLEASPEEKSMTSVSHPESPLLHCTANCSEESKDGNLDLVNFTTNINHATSSSLGVVQRITLPQSANGTKTQASGSLAGDVNGKTDKLLLCASNGLGVTDLPPDGAHTDKCYIDSAVKSHSVANNVVTYMGNVDKKNSTLHGKRSQAMENCMAIGPHTKLEQYQGGKATSQVKRKTKRNREREMDTRGDRETTMQNRKGEPSASTINDTEHKPFPVFESFVLEEEEGSGGYGTVYRAKRKSDGITFAIKYPHVNANRNHVQNELKMLQRVGGKNFVIKYEGSFKSGDSDCLVLEHVKHDRPEVLKREINILQLKWYAYCMFRSLAGLHKMGIVHRDVKPGNFLFSRTTKVGYLIDFNLAMDLHRKQGASDNPKSKHDIKTSLPRSRYLPPIQDSKSVKTSFPEAIDHSAVKCSNSLFPSGILKKAKQAKVTTESNFRNMNINKNQGADGSGITSVKDVTSTRTPSTERLRQPMPSTGRAELMSLAHEALQGGGGNHEPVNAPTSKRKRVAASPQTTDSKCFYPTPMPLHASGLAVHGAGLLRNNVKHRREGPCVGTKGFRAPEVLFKSAHQGPKVDIWSAGVTLLYLMIGRTPFTGEPDQNIKEIAKLRGSEDLWEVAKLHNQESLFPPELFDSKHLVPVKVQDWCAQNTRRPDFQEVLPRSLFDLVDKCLTVNPRLRITAEEALKHDYFTSCYELLRKQRLRRQGLNLDPGAKRESQAL